MSDQSDDDRKPCGKMIGPDGKERDVYDFEISAEPAELRNTSELEHSGEGLGDDQHVTIWGKPFVAPDCGGAFNYDEEWSEGRSVSDLEGVTFDLSDATRVVSLSGLHEFAEEQILNVGDPLTKEQRKDEGDPYDTVYVCPDCDGTGAVDLSLRAERVVECKRCDGSGEVEG